MNYAINSKMKTNEFLCKAFQLPKNKFIEFQMSRWEDAKFFGIERSFRSKHQDHAGWFLAVTLFYHEFSVNLYDRRHADVRAKEEI